MNPVQLSIATLAAKSRIDILIRRNSPKFGKSSQLRDIIIATDVYEIHRNLVNSRTNDARGASLHKYFYDRVGYAMYVVYRNNNFMEMDSSQVAEVIHLAENANFDSMKDKKEKKLERSAVTTKSARMAFADKFVEEELLWPGATCNNKAAQSPQPEPRAYVGRSTEAPWPTFNK